MLELTRARYVEDTNSYIPGTKVRIQVENIAAIEHNADENVRYVHTSAGSFKVMEELDYIEHGIKRFKK